MSTSENRTLEERLEERAREAQAEAFLELDVGGSLRFTPPEFEQTEDRSSGELATPADPVVHETRGSTEYITVHYQNGNYEWFEYNFRVRDGTAYLGSKLRLSDPRNGSGWVPPRVKVAVKEYHPGLTVTEERPPWWE